MKLKELNKQQTIDIIERYFEKFYDCEDLDDLVIAIFYLDKIDYILKHTELLTNSEILDYEIELEQANEYARSFL